MVHINTNRLESYEENENKNDDLDIQGYPSMIYVSRIWDPCDLFIGDLPVIILAIFFCKYDLQLKINYNYHYYL